MGSFHSNLQNFDDLIQLLPQMSEVLKWTTCKFFISLIKIDYCQYIYKGQFLILCLKTSAYLNYKYVKITQKVTIEFKQYFYEIPHISVPYNNLCRYFINLRPLRSVNNICAIVMWAILLLLFSITNVGPIYFMINCTPMHVDLMLSSLL